MYKHLMKPIEIRRMKLKNRAVLRAIRANLPDEIPLLPDISGIHEE